MKKEKWITRTDAAKLAKVSTQTITNWGKSGLITIRVIKNMTYVDKKTLIDLLVDYDIQHKNMKTLGDIATRTVKEIRSIYNLGYHTYIELSDVIEHYGLCWNIDIDYFILTGNINVKIKEG